MHKLRENPRRTRRTLRFRKRPSRKQQHCKAKPKNPNQNENKNGKQNKRIKNN